MDSYGRGWIQGLAGRPGAPGSENAVLHATCYRHITHRRDARHYTASDIKVASTCL